MVSPGPRVVVVGGGIAGLVAALRARLRWPASRVTVLEGSTTLGGKLATAEVAGVRVDVGAEAMLNRRPEGVELASAIGLEPVHPAVVSSRVWSRGAARPLPPSLMGVPRDLDALAASQILSATGLAAVIAEKDVLPPTGVDMSVGDLVAARLGDEVVQRLVEPLLGGVYAGQAHLISARAAVPQLFSLAANGSLVTGELPPSPLPRAQTTYTAPVFAGLVGGMGMLPEQLAGFLIRDGAVLRPGTAVRGLDRATSGFTVAVDEASGAREQLEADVVVLALPPGAAARLLRGLAAEAAAELAAIESASVAVVTFAFGADELPTLSGSGLLVPPVEEAAIKASTFSFAKWDWVREAGRGADGGRDLLFLRTSLGRHGDDVAAQRSDEELIDASRTDLQRLLGIDAQPVDVQVQRWIDGLPQYAVGHLDRVAKVRAAVAQVPGLAVCGAAYDGVGIPAVIGSATRAVADLTEPVASRT